MSFSSSCVLFYFIACFSSFYFIAATGGVGRSPLVKEEEESKDVEHAIKYNRTHDVEKDKSKTSHKE